MGTRMFERTKRCANTTAACSNRKHHVRTENAMFEQKAHMFEHDDHEIFFYTDIGEPMFEHPNYVRTQKRYVRTHRRMFERKN